MTTTPFRFVFAPGEVQRLRQRIDLTRWPEPFEAPDWSYGTDPDYLRELVAYWRDGFDFAAAEERLNALPNFRTEIDRLPVHHIHLRAEDADAVPVLLLHGWPGSVVEFLDVIPRLARPREAGEEAAAFHVVAPSLQGYAGSPGASRPGMSPRTIAGRLARLMEELGYDRYVVQGGDWGSLVGSHLAALHPDRVIGLHLSIAQPVPPADLADPLAVVAEHEKPWLAANAVHAAEGLGYYAIQKTRPQTLAYALTDSPVGWCAWVLDKFHTWTDCERGGVRDLRNAVSWDAFLTNLSLYWFTGTIGSSIRLYREQFLAEQRGEGTPGPITVPAGVGIYPAEIVRSPRAWMERRLPVRHWHEAPAGGHFAALEQPRLFIDDLRAFRNSLAAVEAGPQPA
ncbi:epoxide hydrolase [Arthrobacter sp. I2-34]|uniref:Epoxide hydrolase n=1 Tax=Arthrobacter hankyongi TaxID=2904801 RepID=A0ABS9L3S2_9MICC|nr:epoxide hydrolase family protein [Arthrobacter hankyongi]MCG2621294.1 epoxide hydrolase [Arthrobacter hankyongi]